MQLFIYLFIHFTYFIKQNIMTKLLYCFQDVYISITLTYSMHLKYQTINLYDHAFFISNN